MELTVITLDAVDAAAVRTADGARIVDLLWTAAARGERLEHISVQAGRPGRLHLGMFTVASGERTARATALAICRRALATYPLPGGWRITAAPPLRPTPPSTDLPSPTFFR